MAVHIRTVREAELSILQDIERAAGESFRDIGMAQVADDEPLPIDELDRYRRSGRAWAATDPVGAPIGYLVAEIVDGNLHVEQVSVHPRYARRGVGRQLLDHLAARAETMGVPALTLTTFADVPWNAPYYARCGFRILDDKDLTPGLRAIRQREAAHGLDRWPRVCMRRDLALLRPEPGKYGGRVTEPDPDVHVRQLAARSLDADDPTGWFEQLYAEAAEGRAVVPWFRGAPRPTLVGWAEQRGVTGGGRRALVVGCGLGDDAEYVAGLGFDTVAFDISASAVRAARRRFPESAVEYVVADLLHPPADWREGFDLVVESYNVQSLPKPVQPAAIVQVGHLVRRGGTLLVIAFASDGEPEAGGGEPEAGGGEPDGGGPPWPLTRAEVESFATGGLQPLRIAEVTGGDGDTRWVAEFTRP